jgi:hypothetical protein
MASWGETEGASEDTARKCESKLSTGRVRLSPTIAVIVVRDVSSALNARQGTR